MAKPGRPRTEGFREPNGRLKRGPDRGTKEIQARRKWLAQLGPDGKGEKPGDENKTSYPLGVMLANSVIDEAQHQAGCRYAFLHMAVFGRRSYATLRWDGLALGRGEDPDDAWLARLEANLRDADGIFASRKQHDLVVGLCVFERLPRCMLPTIPTWREVREARLLVEGLARLAEYWRT